MQNRLYKFTSVIFAIVIMSIISLIVGFIIGSAYATKTLVVMGVEFLEEHGVNFDNTAVEIGDVVNHYISLLKEARGSGSTYGFTTLN